MRIVRISAKLGGKLPVRFWEKIIVNGRLFM